jgi:hypothetical protein
LPPIPDRFELHRPRPLSEAPPPTYVELAHEASQGHLGLYIGAGASVPTPTLLPTSTEFLGLLAPFAEQELGLSRTAEGRDAQESLEHLADRADATGVLAALRELAASAAKFRDAPPNYSHRVIAILLREGAASVFTVNWDRCIERGSAEIGFYVDVTITEPDRAVRFANCRYHKVHGCATQPLSLLISTSQLNVPPAWVQHEVGAALGSKTLVFIGLGTVGGYVRKRVAQIIEALGAAARIWVADPYPSRTWTKLLERAGHEHILDIDANSFFDNLLRAWVRHMGARLLIGAGELDALGGDPPLVPVVERLQRALYIHGAASSACGGATREASSVTRSHGGRFVPSHSQMHSLPT